MVVKILLLVALLIFPGVLTLTSQPIDVDVELGNTAFLPFENYDDSKTVLLTKFNASKSTDSPIATVVSLDPDEPLGSAVGLGQFKGRVRLKKTHGSTDIRAELDNVQLNDTGRDIYYDFQQLGVKGRRININIKAPPPAVTSVNITSVGEDYVNITWLQVEPLDPTPINYSVEYREAAERARRNLQATDGADTWQQTGYIPHNPDVPNLQITVDNLNPGSEYQFRVMSFNRFDKSTSHVEVAETVRKASQTGPGLSPGGIAGIVCGAVAVVVGVPLLIWYLRRRRGRRRRRRRRNPPPGRIPPTDRQEMEPLNGQGQAANGHVPQAGGGPGQAGGGPGQAGGGLGQQPASNEPLSAGTLNDGSIPPQHYSEEGERSGLAEVPVFADLDRSVDDMETSLNDLDVQADAVPSENTGRHKAAKYDFLNDVAIYYEDDDPDKDKITEVRRVLESDSWAISVFDPNREGEGGMFETFQQSAKTSRHAIAFLTRMVTEYMAREEDTETEYRMLTTLRNKLKSHDKKFNQKLIVIKLCNNEIPDIFSDLPILKYGEPGFIMKLFSALSIPAGEGTPTLSQMKQKIDLFEKRGIPNDKLWDVAAGLQIPKDVFDDICSPQMYGESGSKERLTATVKCWITHYGEDASMVKLEGVLTRVLRKKQKVQRSMCSSGSPQEVEPYLQSLVQGQLPSDLPSSEATQPMSLWYGEKPTKPTSRNHDKGNIANTQKETDDNGQSAYPEMSMSPKDYYAVLRHILSLSLKDNSSKGVKENRERLQQHVAESGLVFRDPVPGDGNCLFHAISDQLNRLGAEPLSHRELRERAVHRLREHPYTASREHMGCFVEGSWEFYLDQMAKDRHWGDAHVIIALANYLGRDIRIVSSIDSEMYDVIIEPTSSPNNNNAPILLGHYAENHYESLDVARQDGIAHQAAERSRIDVQEHGDAVAGRPAVQNDNESTPLLPQPQEDRTTQQPVFGAKTDVQEHREEVAGRPAVQDDNESTPLLPQPQEDACSQSATTHTKIRHVKKMQWGDHNEMNIGRGRPKTAGSRSHRKTAPQRKGGHGKHHDSGSSIGNVDLDIEDVENFQMGDYNVMNISTLPGQETKDSSRDAGNPSATQSDSSRVVTDSDFQEIQEHIGNKWKAVASGLGLSQGQIDGLEHDLRHETLDEKVYQMLRKWKQLNGQLATVAELKGALREVGLQDVANRIEN